MGLMRTRVGLILLGLLVAGSAAPRAQSSAGSPPPITAADIAQLDTTADTIASRVEVIKGTDPSRAVDLNRSLADLRDDVTYLRVKLRRDGAVTAAEFAEVRDRLEALGVRVGAPGPQPPPGGRAPSRVVTVPVGTQ